MVNKIHSDSVLKSLYLNPENQKSKGVPINVDNLNKANSLAIDVLSLNTYSIPERVAKEKNVFQRSTRIGYTIRNYDVVGLQETFDKKTEQINKVANEENHTMNYFKPQDKRIGTSGLEILSKYKIVEKEFKPFTYSTDAEALAKKGVAYTRLEVPKVGFIDVYDTHYQANGDKNYSWAKSTYRKAASLIFPGFNMPHNEIRKSQNTDLSNFVKKHEQGYPTIIMGDFNTNEKNDTYSDLISKLGVKDSFRVLNPNDPGYTSDGYNNPLKGGSHRSRIDFILYKSGTDYDIKPLSSEVTVNKPIGGMYVSDHFGVHTKFKIAKKPKQILISA